MSMVLVSGNEACTEGIATTQAKIPKSCSEDSEGPQQERKGNQLNMEGSPIFFLHMSAFCGMYTRARTLVLSAMKIAKALNKVHVLYIFCCSFSSPC
jgi:hypothetical protein